MLFILRHKHDITILMSLNIKNIEIIHGFILYYFQNLIPYVTVKRILIQLVLSHFFTKS